MNGPAMELPEGFTRNPGERRVPEGITSETCVTMLCRDGAVLTGHRQDEPAYWYFSALTPMLDIIGYKIEDATACDVNSW